MRRTEPPRSRERGQILLPTLLLLPALFLLVALVVDTGRLSRDKIRQQFALDAASRQEMEQYTDTLNRLAYVNGAFPDRIFREMYGAGWGAYYDAGAFPAAPGGVNEDAPLWPIRFNPRRDWINVPDDGLRPPEHFGVLHMHPEGGGGSLVTLGQAQQVAVGYITAYRWLGDVAMYQKIVFEQMILNNHPLLRKSLWLNLPDDSGPGSCLGGVGACGQEPADAFKRIRIRMHVLDGFRACHVLVTVGGVEYVGVMSGAFSLGVNGLWQLATVHRDDLDMLKEGFVVTSHWAPGKNYFGVGADGEWPRPYVRARVLTLNGSVWPDPTPKYYTSLYP